MRRPKRLFLLLVPFELFLAVFAILGVDAFVTADRPLLFLAGVITFGVLVIVLAVALVVVTVYVALNED